MNLTRTLREEAIDSAPWLFTTLGFEVIEESYHREAFGNSTLTLRSPRLLVHFQRDRGCTTAFVASPTEQPRKWWFLDFVLEVARNEIIKPCPLDFFASAVLLRDNIDQFARALGDDYPRVTDLLVRRMPEKTEANRRFAVETLKPWWKTFKPWWKKKKSLGL